MIVDFCEIKDGEIFEYLIEDICKDLCLNPSRSGRGADGGRDIIIDVEESSIFNKKRTKWLIQCKHRAISRKSVTPNDVGSIVDRCLQHNVNGYLLVTSTTPSFGLKDILDGIDNNSQHSISAKCWAKNKLVDLIIERPTIFQKYFPISFEKYFNKVTVSEVDVRNLFQNLYKRIPTPEEIRLIIFNSIRFGISKIDTIERIITDEEVFKVLKEIYNRLLFRAPDPTGLFIYGWWYKNITEDKRLGYIEQSIKISPEYKNTIIKVDIPSDVLSEVINRVTCCLNCQSRDSGEWVWVIGKEYGLLSEMIDEVFEKLYPDEFEKFSNRLHSYELQEGLTCPNCGSELEVECIVGEGEL